MGRRIHIAVNLLSPGWRDALPQAAVLGRRAARTALKRAPTRQTATPLAGSRSAGSPSAAIELGLVLADDELAHRLNRQYRGIDRPTNVLSFGGYFGESDPSGVEPGGCDPADGLPIMLGDIVLARETIIAEAAAQGKTLAAHFGHLVVHGVLHLLGYDHENSVEAAEMEGIEVSVLAELGIANPYLMEVDPGSAAPA